MSVKQALIEKSSHFVVCRIPWLCSKSGDTLSGIGELSLSSIFVVLMPILLRHATTGSTVWSLSFLRDLQPTLKSSYSSRKKSLVPSGPPLVDA